MTNMIDEECREMAQYTVETFAQAKATLTSVESCTGGLLSAAITSIDGASSVINQALVTYSNEAKQKLVNVSADTLKEFGAVSAQCAVEMALGGLKVSGANACVSITGIAGPTGGSDEKPVGTVFIAVASDFEEGAYCEECHFQNQDRDTVRLNTVKTALEMLVAYGLDVELN